jgi:hypothetical protein
MIIYAGIGAFGLLLLLVMLVGGEIFGGDHDLTHDVSHIGEGGGPSVFSLRIMAAFLTAFGVGGIVARLLQPLASGRLGHRVVAGIGMAGVVYQFAKLLVFAAGIERAAHGGAGRGDRRSLGGDSGRRRRADCDEQRRACAASTLPARAMDTPFDEAPRWSSRESAEKRSSWQLPPRGGRSDVSLFGIDQSSIFVAVAILLGLLGLVAAMALFSRNYIKVPPSTVAIFFGRKHTFEMRKAPRLPLVSASCEVARRCECPCSSRWRTSR